MTRLIIALGLIHFLGMVAYITTVDEWYCQGDYHQKVANDCYAWKVAAGVWEIVLIQELIIRPIVRE